MAVFTDVSFDEARQLVAALGLGQLTSLQGIQAGIENSNFFLSCEQGGVQHDHVLTVFERLTAPQLPFYLGLMQHLAQRGLPVPEPQGDAQGRLLQQVCGKPAAVVQRLPGEHVLAPDLQHCEQLGAMLARLHRAASDFALQQPNLRGITWWNETAPGVRPFLQPEQQALLDSELLYQHTLADSPAYRQLPRGAIHADIFRDNVVFEDDRLSGIFDFYFAGIDVLLFDIAVCLNDWCIDLESGRLDEARAAALMSAYGGVRALSGAERRLLPAVRRAAALRFWLSRLHDLLAPRDATLLQPRDPQHFEHVLRDCIARPWHDAIL